MGAIPFRQVLDGGAARLEEAAQTVAQVMPLHPIPHGHLADLSPLDTSELPAGIEAIAAIYGQGIDILVRAHDQIIPRAAIPLRDVERLLARGSAEASAHIDIALAIHSHGIHRCAGLVADSGAQGGPIAAVPAGDEIGGQPSRGVEGAAS